MTDTAPADRGGFPDVRPVEDAPDELRRYVAALRRLHDLTVSTNPGDALWADAAAHLESACALLDGHQVPEAENVAGRVLSIPGLGHPLMPPWTVIRSGPDGVTMAGGFTEAHVGGNRAVHGGIIPLLYDWLFGMAVTAADVFPTRTAFLHVDYRKITPIDEPLEARCAVSRIDGRKVFIEATMTSADGAVLSEANGLMVRLLPHQP
ncbi:PaaI family thioesterase [Candidatus Mycobacterium wuenschmannii]|uniref:Acyl-coenzyme A thioesterase THEM4 n=1 Tax=Candidatus Mycobacterium wuenschmannii TaxID=3027808 RepID=A0ABY8W124_9MYCO|nr:PaaI family thioesterase [Candidatus Mycobacterium wuenschmannii]WIM89595.1 PaaI family thioesterase [Candidatus Mycobacterium wuenschmannii]